MPILSDPGKTLYERFTRSQQHARHTAERVFSCPKMTGSRITRGNAVLRRFYALGYIYTTHTIKARIWAPGALVVCLYVIFSAAVLAPGALRWMPPGSVREWLQRFPGALCKPPPTGSHPIPTGFLTRERPYNGSHSRQP